MNRTTLNRNAVLGAVLLGISSFSLTGCGQKTSEEHMLAAHQFIEAKDNQSAIIEYKSAIQKDPQDPNARYELGKLYLEQKDFAAAEKELNRALDLGYEVSKVLPLITRAYQETNSEVALSEINHNVDGLTPVKRAEITYYKLEALLRLEKNAEARVLLEDIAKIDTSSVYKGLSLALGNVLDDKFEDALKQVNALQAQSPMNKDVLMQQARLNMYLRNLDEAVTAYNAYLDVAPQDTETKFILTAILMDAKRFEEASPLVDDLLEKSATNSLLNQFKGIIDAREGNYTGALKHLETAIKNGRTDPLARLLAGFSAYQLEDYDATTRHLSMIASDLPPSHAALRMLADSLLKQGKNEEATDILARVDGEAENDALLFSKAGYQLLQEGNVVDAKAMIEKSVPIATTAEDLTRIGVLQLSINDAEGLVNLEAAVEQAPELNVSQQTLANAYIATRQFDKALEVAENWQKSDPQNATPWLVRGQVYIAQQNYTAAEAAISKAEALDNNNIRAKLQRVSLAMLQQQPQQAMEAINVALSIDESNQAALALLYIVQKQLGKANEAVNYIQEVISRNPDNAIPKILLARVYLAEGEINKGIDLIQQVPVTADTPDLFWDSKGRLLLAGAKINEAKAHYETWLTEQPNNKTALLGMALLLDLQSRFQNGLELTSNFLEKRPDRQIEIVKAHFHAMLRQIPQTEAILDTLSEQEQALPYVRGIRARLQIYRDNPTAAIDNALAAYQAIPNIRNLLLVMAAYEMADQPDNAFELLTAFMQDNPDNTQGLLLYAERLIARDRSQAVKVYRQLVEKQPENAIALNNLAYLEHQEGMLDEAEKHARQALKVIPNAPEVADTLAQVLIEKGDNEDAKAIYDSVMSEPVRNEEIYLNYVELLLKMDLTPLAKRRLADRLFESAESKTRVAELEKQYNL